MMAYRNILTLGLGKRLTVGCWEAMEINQNFSTAFKEGS